MADDFRAEERAVPMIVKKNSLYSVGIVVLVVAGVIFLSLNQGSSLESYSDDNQETQIVKLSVKNGEYILEPPQLKKNVKVRLEADLPQMPGCSKSIVIPAFKVSKTVSSKDNTIEFIPNKAGTFYIACSMNMYKGTLTVLESDGAKNSYVQTPPSSGASCGAGGGGCGCGG